MSAFAVANHSVWGEVAPEITPRDFNNPEKMDVDFLRLLSRIRRKCGVPFRIVSDHRTPGTNPGAAKSAHMELPCKAVDLRVLNNPERFKIVRAAFEEGIVRFGIYAPTPEQVKNFGEMSGSVHLDVSTDNPQGTMWMKWAKPDPA